MRNIMWGPLAVSFYVRYLTKKLIKQTCFWQLNAFGRPISDPRPQPTLPLRPDPMVAALAKGAASLTGF